MLEQSGRKPQMLKDKPELDEIGSKLWLLYTDIKRGCDMVSYTAIESYQNIMGDTLTPYEASLMLSIDQVRRNA